MSIEVCLPVSASRHSTAQVVVPSLRTRSRMLAMGLSVGSASTKKTPVSTPGPSSSP